MLIAGALALSAVVNAGPINTFITDKTLESMTHDNVCFRSRNDAASAPLKVCYPFDGRPFSPREYAELKKTGDLTPTDIANNPDGAEYSAALKFLDSSLYFRSLKSVEAIVFTNHPFVREGPRLLHRAGRFFVLLPARPEFKIHKQDISGLLRQLLTLQRTAADLSDCLSKFNREIHLVVGPREGCKKVNELGPNHYQYLIRCGFEEEKTPSDPAPAEEGTAAPGDPASSGNSGHPMPPKPDPDPDPDPEASNSPSADGQVSPGDLPENPETDQIEFLEQLHQQEVEDLDEMGIDTSQIYDPFQYFGSMAEMPELLWNSSDPESMIGGIGGIGMAPPTNPEQYLLRIQILEHRIAVLESERDKPSKDKSEVWVINPINGEERKVKLMTKDGQPCEAFRDSAGDRRIICPNDEKQGRALERRYSSVLGVPDSEY